MKIRYLLSAVLQIIVGVAAVIGYIVAAVSGEPLGRWAVTLILAIAFVLLGIVGVIDYIRSSKTK